jgi:hypothetical protein
MEAFGKQPSGRNQPVVIRWNRSEHDRFDELVHWIRCRPASQEVHVYVERAEQFRPAAQAIRVFQALGCTVTSRMTVPALCA